MKQPIATTNLYIISPEFIFEPAFLIAKFFHPNDKSRVNQLIGQNQKVEIISVQNVGIRYNNTKIEIGQIFEKGIAELR